MRKINRWCLAFFLVLWVDLSALNLSTALDDFKEKYEEECDEGYPFYSWVVSDSLVEKELEGGYWQLGRPVVLGSTSWHNKVFENLLQLSVGQAYSCSDLENARVLLKNFTGVSVKKGPLLYKHFNKRHLIPVWQVEDEKTNSLNLNLNASEGEWAGVGDFFIGRILGYPRELLLHFSKYNDVQEYAFMYKEPWLFEYPLGLRFNLGVESVDSTSFWVGSTFKLEGEIGYSLKWAIGIDGELERWKDENLKSKYLERWGIPWELRYLNQFSLTQLDLSFYGGHYSNFVPNVEVTSYRKWGGAAKFKQSVFGLEFYQKFSHEFIDTPPSELSPNEGFNPRHSNWSPRGMPMLRLRALKQSLLSMEVNYLMKNAGVGLFHDFYYADFERYFQLYSYGPSLFTHSLESKVDWSLYLAWTYQMKHVLEGRLGFRMKYLF